MRGTTPLIRSRRDWVATTDPLPTKSFDVIVARLTRGAETIAESFAPCRIGSPPPACASILSTSHFASAEVTRSEEHTSELQSLMRSSYAVFCLKKKKIQQQQRH